MSSSRKRRKEKGGEGPSEEEEGAEGLIQRDEKRKKLNEEDSDSSGILRRSRKVIDYTEYDDVDEVAVSDSSDSYHPDVEEESVKDEEQSDFHEEQSEFPSSAVNKYYIAAGNVLSIALDKVLSECSCEARIVDLCETGDESITMEAGKQYLREKKLKKGIAFPTCVSVNRNICHFSPPFSDNSVLRENDLVKIEMGAHFGGNITMVAHTIQINKERNAVSGRAADVIAAANTVATRVTQLIRPGVRMKNIIGELQNIVREFDCMLFRMNACERGFSIDSEEDAMCFQKDKVYVIDIITCSGEGKIEEMDATIFKVIEDRRGNVDEEFVDYFDNIHETFHDMAFTTRALEAHDLETGIQNIQSAVQLYPVLCMKDGDLNAHVMFTVVVKADQVIKITPDPKAQKVIPLRQFNAPWLAADANINKKVKESEHELVYAGFLPIGEEGSGVTPVIESISWNKNLSLTDDNLAFLCCGSFGTYVCSRLSEPNDDLQCGWVKKLVSEVPVKICSWNPNEKAIIAIGSEANSGEVHILNLDTGDTVFYYGAQAQRYGIRSVGINSLSWSKNGSYLPFAGNNTNVVGVIKYDKLRSWTRHLEYSVYGKRNHKADVVAVFHPFVNNRFALATSSGIINIFKKKSANELKKAVKDEWDRCSTRQTNYGFCAIQFVARGNFLACGRTDGGIVVYSYYGATSKSELNIQEIYNLDSLAGGLSRVNFVVSDGPYPLMATIDEAQLINIYNNIDKENATTHVCDNEKSIIRTTECNKTDVLLWMKKRVLVSGGRDGILHFWMLLPKWRTYNTYKARNRDFRLEKAFYNTKRISLTPPEATKMQSEQLANLISSYSKASSAEVEIREEQRKKALDLANGGLGRIYRGEELTQAEMLTYLEEIARTLSSS